MGEVPVCIWWSWSDGISHFGFLIFYVLFYTFLVLFSGCRFTPIFPGYLRFCVSLALPSFSHDKSGCETVKNICVFIAGSEKLPQEDQPPTQWRAQLTVWETVTMDVLANTAHALAKPETRLQDGYLAWNGLQQCQIPKMRIAFLFRRTSLLCREVLQPRNSASLKRGAHFSFESSFRPFPQLPSC